MNKATRFNRHRQWLQVHHGHGFTLLELLLVIAIIAILAVSSTPFLSRFVLQTHTDSMVDKTMSSIRKAQGYAMDNKNNQTWGVCVSGSQLRLYAGTCNSPSLAENFSIPSTVSLGGLSDVTFNNRGEPSATPTITISTSIESVTLQLNAAGGLARN